MPSFSHATFVGHVGRDPEMKYTPNGTAVTVFSLGVSVGWGERKATLWVDVSCFGKLAETVNNGVTKGQAVLVDGAPGSLAYEVDGEKRYRKALPLVAQQVRFLGPKGELQPRAEDDEESDPFV